MVVKQQISVFTPFLDVAWAEGSAQSEMPLGLGPAVGLPAWGGVCISRSLFDEQWQKSYIPSFYPKARLENTGKVTIQSPFWLHQCSFFFNLLKFSIFPPCAHRSVGPRFAEVTLVCVTMCFKWTTSRPTSTHPETHRTFKIIHTFFFNLPASLAVLSLLRSTLLFIQSSDLNYKYLFAWACLKIPLL